MKFYIQQHIFTWGDKFSIYDINGNECYFVEGEVFTFGKKLHLCNLQGGELAYIEQQLLTFLPRYLVYRGDMEIAEVVKEFTFFHPEYTVNGLGWQVRGDFWNHDYDVLAGDEVIASVQKEWFTLGDAYEISIADGVDPVTALAIVLVIDACIDAQRRN
ncbi:MAG: LURP-one-related family protein [Clostridia bacterium]|nr:LURP-one-related family protein [Clostridia bacterium]